MQERKETQSLLQRQPYAQVAIEDGLAPTAHAEKFSLVETKSLVLIVHPFKLDVGNFNVNVSLFPLYQVLTHETLERKLITAHGEVQRLTPRLTDKLKNRAIDVTNTRIREQIKKRPRFGRQICGLLMKTLSTHAVLHEGPLGGTEC